MHEAITQISNSQGGQEQMDVSADDMRRPNPTNQGTSRDTSIDNTAEIQQSEVQDIILAMQSYTNYISNQSKDDIIAIKELLDHVKSCRKTVIQRITFMPYIKQLTLAVEQREKELNIVQTMPQIPSTSNDLARQNIEPNRIITYRSLYQYQCDMNQRNCQDAVVTLTTAPAKQLKNYNAIGVIERTNRSAQLPFYDLFVRQPMVRNYLTKDQCNIIMSNINPNKNITSREFPQFNPDFHFPCTIFGIHITQKFNHFESFVGPHRESQLNLEQHKNLTPNEVEGRFAFEQNAHWIQLTFDSSLNIEWNERIAFTMVNGIPPNSSDSSDDTRVFCARCMNTGAWDGHNTYFLCKSASKMGQTLNILRNLSVHLSTGNFQVNILTPKSFVVDSSSLPKPAHYEQLICLQNTWCNLTKRQLVKQLQTKFSPCVIFGSVYLPNYSNTAFGVTGKSISMMPAFQNTILESEYDSLFSWSIEQGRWNKNNSTDFTHESHYMSQIIPTLETQKERYENTRAFSTQIFAPQEQLVYGSNHFWTIYRRNKQYNAVLPINISESLTAQQKFSEGENPYSPSLSHMTILDRLILPRHLSEVDKETCYHLHLDNECKRNLEMAMRYRRAQFVLGFSSPYLYYNRLDGMSRLEKRVLSIQEFVTKPLNQADTHIFRKMDISKLQWIPRELVSQYDEISGTCLSKRDMAHLRLQRVDKEARQTQYNQQKSKSQKFANREFTKSPVNKKSKK